MSVKGNEIIENCRECFTENGFGVKQGNLLVCSHNPVHRYVIEEGFLKRI